jgi:hypothetical protein
MSVTKFHVTREKVGGPTVNTKLLCGALLSLGAVGAAVLALAFLPRGVAAAAPDNDLLWWADEPNWTATSQVTNFGDTITTGYGPMDGIDWPFFNPDIQDPDGLTATGTVNYIPGLDDYESGTFDVTGGDAATLATIPVGSTITVDEYFNGAFGCELVESPGLGLFGLPEVTETFFTGFGDFSI